jgi:hypothetical protein
MGFIDEQSEWVLWRQSRHKIDEYKEWVLLMCSNYVATHP